MDGHEVTERDPVLELFARREAEWRERIKRKYRFRPRKARRVIWEHDEIRRRLREWDEAHRERARLLDERERRRAGSVGAPASGERSAE